MSGLDYSDKNALRASWSKFCDNKVANGGNFYMALFKKDPKTLGYFSSLFKDVSYGELKSSSQMQAQSVVFCDTMSSFIDNLDNVDILNVLIQKMAKHHFNRGLRVDDLRAGFGVLVRYIQESCGGGSREWDKLVDYICSVMNETMRGLS